MIAMQIIGAGAQHALAAISPEDGRAQLKPLLFSYWPSFPPPPFFLAFLDASVPRCHSEIGEERVVQATVTAQHETVQHRLSEAPEGAHVSAKVGKTGERYLIVRQARGRDVIPGGPPKVVPGAPRRVVTASIEFGPAQSIAVVGHPFKTAKIDLGRHQWGGQRCAIGHETKCPTERTRRGFQMDGRLARGPSGPEPRSRRHLSSAETPISAA